MNRTRRIREHRAPPCPPIDPTHVYPWRRLADWGIGSRTLAAMLEAGLEVLEIGKLQFVSGSAIIACMRPQDAEKRAAKSAKLSRARRAYIEQKKQEGR